MGGCQVCGEERGDRMCVETTPEAFSHLDCWGKDLEARGYEPVRPSSAGRSTT